MLQRDISRVAILLSVLDAHEGSAQLISDFSSSGLAEMSLHWPHVVNISPLVVHAAMPARRSILVLSDSESLIF